MQISIPFLSLGKLIHVGIRKPKTLEPWVFFLVQAVGFEPTTVRVSVECSTN